MYVNVSDPSPVLMVPRQEDREAWARITLRLVELQTQMQQARHDAAGPFAEWLRARKPGAAADPLDDKGAIFSADLGALVAASPNYSLHESAGSSRPAIGFGLAATS